MNWIQKQMFRFLYGKSQSFPIDGSRRYYRASGSPFKYFFPTGLDTYEYIQEEDFETILEQAYGLNPHIYTVVDRLQDVGSGLDWIIVDKEGTEINDARTEALREFMKRPNPMYSGDELLHKAIGYFLSTGNNIFYKRQADIAGRDVLGLYVAHIPDVEINTVGREGTTPTSYRIETETFVPMDVCHLKMPNIVRRSDWGLSPLYAGQYVWNASSNTFVAQSAIHKNRGMAGVISPQNSDIPMLPKEQEALQADWDRRTAGPGNFGRVHITTQAMKYTPVGMTPSDLKLIESNIQSLRDACNLYGVSSSLFNDPANKTYNNQEQAEESFYMDVVLPLMDKQIFAKLSWWLLPQFGLGDAKIVVDRSKIPALNKPDKDKSDKVQGEVASGILTERQGQAELYPEMEEEGTIQAEDLIRYQTAVAAGDIPRETAVNTLVELYGYDRTTAGSLLP